MRHYLQEIAFKIMKIIIKFVQLLLLICYLILSNLFNTIQTVV